MKNKTIKIMGMGVVVLMILIALVPMCSAGIMKDRYDSLGLGDIYSDEQWEELEEMPTEELPDKPWYKNNLIWEIYDRIWGTHYYYAFGDTEL